MQHCCSTLPMMQRNKDPAGAFKTMAEVSSAVNLTLNSEDTENTSTGNSGESWVRMRLSFSSENDLNTLDEANVVRQDPTLQSVSDLNNATVEPFAEIAEGLSTSTINTCLKAQNAFELEDASTEHNRTKQNCANSEDKENSAVPTTTIASDDAQEEDTCGQRNQGSNTTDGEQHSRTEVGDAESVRRAQEEGCVNVVFPGTVTQEGCCRFVSEILKCILYQRQQLPMTYDQLVYSQKKHQASMQDKDIVSRRPVQSADMDWRKRQQTLQDLEEVLQQLEVLFSLSRVPRVLLLLGGSLVLPKEMYEINMEALVLSGGGQCLRVSSCLRQLFRTLFVADLLSDTRPVRLMSTTVLVLAHRNCGVGWFRPKLQYKVPTRVKNQIISLSTDPNTFNGPRADESDWRDYVWFQAPLSIKGFSN